MAAETEMSAVDAEADLFANVPDKVILRIFTYLTCTQDKVNASGVCKKWLKISVDPILWKQVELDGRGRGMTKEKAVQLLRRMGMLRTLDLSHWRDGDADFILDAIEGFPDLQSISLVHFDNGVSVHALTEFVRRYAAQIKLMSVCWSEFPDDFPHPMDIMAPCQNLQELYLDFNYCKFRTPDASLQRNWEKLTIFSYMQKPGCTVDPEINLMASKYGGQIKDLRIHGDLSDQAVLLKFDKAEELTLAFLGIRDDTFLEWVGKLNLRCLTLQEVRKSLSASAMCNLLSLPNIASHLQELTLCIGVNVDDSCLAALSNCTQLTSLSLAECHEITLTGLLDVVKSCESLQNICAYDCQQIDRDEAANQIAQVRPDLNFEG